MARDTVDILGVRVATDSLEEIAARVVRLAEGQIGPGGSAYVCATSVHGLIEGTRDPSFRRILNRAAVVAPDGVPLVWFGRLSSRRRMTRVYGPALMKRVCELSVTRRVPHFLYGAAPGVADELAGRLSAEFPGLRIVGTLSPPYRALTDAESVEVVRTINASGARIVWVGLGTPRQERWAAAMRPRLQVPVVVTVGAAFDFHAGRMRQAPAWMQRNGLEWLYRLIQEPRRLWRRYAFNNPLFLAYALLQLLGLKKFSSDV